MRHKLLVLLLILLSNLGISQLELVLPGSSFVKISSSPNGLLLLQKSLGIYSWNGVQEHLLYKDGNLMSINNQNYLSSGNFFIKENSIGKFENDSIKLNFVPNRIAEINDGYLIAGDNCINVYKAQSHNIEKYFCNNLTKPQIYSFSKEHTYLTVGKLIFKAPDYNSPIFQANSIITHVSMYMDKVLFLAKGRINVLHDSIAKQLNPAFGKMPTDVLKIKASNQKIYFISSNNLFEFDWITSEISLLGSFEGEFKSWTVDHWGQLWVASTTGLYQHLPEDISTGPICNITKVQSLRNGEEKPYLDNDILKVDLQTVYLPNAGNVELQSKNNINGGWTTVNSPVIIDLNGLSGKNERHYRAVSGANVSNIEKLSFQVNKANSINYLFWGILFSTIACLILLSLFSILRVNSEKAKMQEAITRLSGENKILQLEQQTYSLQLKPHFIFNSLTSIKALVQSNNSQEASSSLNNFSKFLRSFLYQSQSKYVVLEDEIKMLKHYLALEKLNRKMDFNYAFEVENEILLEEKIPNLTVQPFIENAIIHGFSSIDYAGIINVKFAEKDDYLVCIITDNGIGIKSAVPKSNHKSVAISLIKERLKRLDKSQKSNYVIYNKLNPGTEVIVYFHKL